MTHCSHLEPLFHYVLPYLPRQEKRNLANYVLFLKAGEMQVTFSHISLAKGNDLAAPNFKVAEKDWTL